MEYQSPVTPELQKWLGRNYVWEDLCPAELVFREKPHYRWCESAVPGAILTKEWDPCDECYIIKQHYPNNHD